MELNAKMLSSIVNLGFAEELFTKTYKFNRNDLEETLTFLNNLKCVCEKNNEALSEKGESFYKGNNTDKEDQIGFLKSPKKLTALKELLLIGDNEDINNTIISSDFSMSDLKEIIDNQDLFLDVLNDIHTRNIEKINCEKLIIDSDKKNIKKIAEIGYTEILVEQAYYTCSKNEEDTIFLLQTS